MEAASVRLSFAQVRSFKEAIAESAVSIVVAHNHPSGNPTPSADDAQVTRDLVAAGKLLDIEVLDHVVIRDQTLGPSAYASAISDSTEPNSRRPATLLGFAYCKAVNEVQDADADRDPQYNLHDADQEPDHHTENIDDQDDGNDCNDECKNDVPEVPSHIHAPPRVTGGFPVVLPGPSVLSVNGKIERGNYSRPAQRAPVPIWSGRIGAQWVQSESVAKQGVS
jgi:hypothetical protein